MADKQIRRSSELKSPNLNSPGSSKIQVSDPEALPDEAHIPLAAKDSEWADVTYLRTKRHESVNDHEEVDETELNIVHPSIEELPIFALFPSLRSTFPNNILSDNVSTTDIAKSLVGKKPKFEVMKMSAKLLPTTTHQLDSIEEIPPDECDIEEETCDKETKQIPEASFESPEIIQYFRGFSIDNFRSNSSMGVVSQMSTVSHRIEERFDDRASKVEVEQHFTKINNRKNLVAEYLLLSSKII